MLKNHGVGPPVGFPKRGCPNELPTFGRPRSPCSPPAVLSESYWGGNRQGIAGFVRWLAYVRSLASDGLSGPAPTTGNSMENRRSSFTYEELLACGRGELFNEGPQLPLPPMLMFDRISEIAEKGGEY